MIAAVIDAHKQPSPEGADDEPGRAFADVAREQLDGLYGYCVRLTNDRTDAEDLVQDTLLRALRAYPGLRDEKTVKSWLFTIATNGWRDLCRARGRTLATVEELDRAARTREIGRMLSGERVTAEALRHAEQLLKLAAE